MGVRAECAGVFTFRIRAAAVPLQLSCRSLWKTQVREERAVRDSADARSARQSRIHFGAPILAKWYKLKGWRNNGHESEESAEAVNTS